MRTNYLGGQSIDWSGRKTPEEILLRAAKETGFLDRVATDLIGQALEDTIEAFFGLGKAAKMASGGLVKFPRENPFEFKDSPCRYMRIHDEIQVDLSGVEMRISASIMEKRLDAETVKVLGGQRIPR